MVETFQIVPARSSVALLCIMALVLLVLLGVTVLLGGALRASRSATFDVGPEGLRLHGELPYRRLVPAASIVRDGVRAVDLDREHELALASRTAGTGLPGYAGGWFRLADGTKALVYVTDRQRVVHVPTTEGFSVLLSVTDPERMVAALRNR